jgi:hypothetical protein
VAGGSDFIVDIEASVRGNAVSELDSLQSSLEDAIGAYRDLETQQSKTAKALEKIGGQISGVQDKMAKAMSAGDTEGFWKLAGVLDKLKTKETALGAEATKTKAALEAQKHVVEGAAKAVRGGQERAKGTGDGDIEGAAGGLKKLGGPIGRIGDTVEEFSESWGKLTGSLGKSGAVFAVAAVAVVALTAALIAGVVGVGKFALTSANAARDAHLATQAFIIQTGAVAGLESAMADVGKSTGVAVDRQKDIVRALQGANVAAGDIPEALKAIATQEAALGDSSGTQQLIDDLKQGKKSVGALAKEMDSKFGGIAKKRMLGLDQQAQTLEKNLGSLFSGLNIEGVLEGIAKLVGLFDTSTESGSALKTLMGVIFQPLANSTTGIFTKIERFILGVEIGAVNVAIAVKKLAKEFNFDLGAMKDWPDVADIGEAAAYGIAAALGLVAAAGYAIYTAFENLADVVTILLSIGEASNAAWAAIGEFIMGLPDAAGDAVAAAALIGSAITDGIAQGIEDGAEAVIAAITGVANDAVATAKKILGVNSPSKVFAAEVGGPISEGIGYGIEEDSHFIGRALDRVTDPSQVDVKSAAGAGGELPPITISVTGSGDPAQTAALVEEALVRVLSGYAETQGVRA